MIYIFSRPLYYAFMKLFSTAFLCCQSFFIELIHIVPVDDTEEVFHKIRSAVLVLQIVGMFPYVQCQQRFLPFCERIILVGGRENFQMVSVKHQPCPAASELGNRSRCKFLFEIFKGTKVSFNLFSHRAVEGSASLRCHHFPEKGVVEITAAIVSHSAADVFGKKIQVADEITDRLICSSGWDSSALFRLAV